MFDLEQAIADWRRQMIAAGIKTPALLDELESHLRDEMAQQMRSGLDAPHAFEVAVRLMGQGRVLKPEFAKAGPARHVRIRKYLIPAMGVGMGLFAVGISLCWFVMIPLASRASKQYDAWLGIGGPPWVTANHIAFFCRFALGMGLAVAMPAALLFLVGIGFLNHRKLAGLRRYAMVPNLVLGALITGPEVVPQLLMFVVLQSLYEVSIWISSYCERKGRRARI